MLNVKKHYVLDENRKPYAVQIPISEFERIEEILENHGLSKLMDDTEGEPLLSADEALEYYQKLKKNVDG